VIGPQQQRKTYLAECIRRNCSACQSVIIIKTCGQHHGDEVFREWRQRPGELALFFGAAEDVLAWRKRRLEEESE
jgi:hypothetical protein